MKKLLIILGLILALFGGFYIYVTYFSAEHIETKETPNEFTLAFHDVTIAVGESYFFLDGQSNAINEMDLSITPIIKDERSAIPLEVFDSAYGLKSNFDRVEYTVTSRDEKTGFEAVMKIGANSITINDKERNIDAPLFFSDDEVYIPLMTAINNSDSMQEYDDATKSIKITRKVEQRTAEEIKAMDDFKMDSYNATLLAKAAAQLCTFNQTFIQMHNFSNQVTIGFDYIKEYLPNGDKDWATLLSGTAPWIITVYEQEYRITDSTFPVPVIYFQGRFDYVNTMPTATPHPVVDPVPETEEEYEDQLNIPASAEEEPGGIFGNNP